MKPIYRKIISAFLPIPLFFGITFCCCLERDSSADENVSNSSAEHHQELEKSEHADHHEHSHGDDACTCSKNLSFLSEQSADIIFDSSLSQMLAKVFTANIGFDNVFFLAVLSTSAQGPPYQDHFDRVSLPIYLKISNLRI